VFIFEILDLIAIAFSNKLKQELFKRYPTIFCSKFALQYIFSNDPKYLFTLFSHQFFFLEIHNKLLWSCIFQLALISVPFEVVACTLL
jgi:hypothetical protein